MDRECTSVYSGDRPSDMGRILCSVTDDLTIPLELRCPMATSIPLREYVDRANRHLYRDECSDLPACSRFFEPRSNALRGHSERPREDQSP